MMTANITPWSFLADMMGQGQAGGTCVPIVPCRSSQHIGGRGITKINDVRPRHSAASLDPIDVGHS